MKRLLFILTALSAIILSACHYHGINGDLDGQWQLMSVEMTDPDSVYTPDRTYFCFDMHVVNLTHYGWDYSHPGNMAYDSDRATLSLDFPYDNNLRRWALPQAPCCVTFHIDHLSARSLVMTRDDNGSVFTFRKF